MSFFFFPSVALDSIIHQIKNGLSREGKSRRNTITVAVASLNPGSVNFSFRLPETGGGADVHNAHRASGSFDLCTSAGRICFRSS